MSVDLFVDDEPVKDNPETAPLPPDRKRSSGFQLNLTWLLVLAVIVLAALQFRGCIPYPDDDSSPTPIVTDGAAVLFATDPDRMESLTIGQAQVAASQIVQTWCEEHGVAYRAYDVGLDMTAEDKQWRQMMDAAKTGTPPNMVTVDDDGNGAIKDIPESVDATIKILETLVD